MTPTPRDHTYARSNPWALTPHQCYILRLICQHGSCKRAAFETDLPVRTVEHHVSKARKTMGSFGNDLRIFIEWDRWVREFNNKN